MMKFVDEMNSTASIEPYLTLTNNILKVNLIDKNFKVREIDSFIFLNDTIRVINDNIADIQ